MPRPIMLCYGTRPQVIKASVLRRALQGVRPVVAVDTGQHYDYQLNELLYQQLGVEPPDLSLEVGSASHARQTGAILERLAPVLEEHRPELVVVIGDTNSTLGSALAAAQLRIPVAHVEAGLRANDRFMAEEINRRMVDAIADLLFTPSSTSTQRLERERPDAHIVESGDVAYDVLLSQLDHLPEPNAVTSQAVEGEYFYSTLHRAELTDHPERFLAVLEALDTLPLPVILPLHPRARKALNACAPDRKWPGALQLHPPVGYRESLALCRDARAVLTDSGGVQREAYWLGVPCVTVRSETEWSETIEEGANAVLDPVTAPHALPDLVELQVRRKAAGWNRGRYGQGKAGEAIADAIARRLSE